MNDKGGIDVRSATPVLKSSDHARTRQYFVEKLGFEIAEEGGDPPRFGIFERGATVIFIDAWHRPANSAPEGVEGWAAYIHVRGLDAIRAEFRAAGLEIRRPIEQTNYGMREFEVADPDGNVICFGEDAEPAD